MNQILNISEAASLGLHTMGILAFRTGGERQTVKSLALALGASESHLAKVMQKLSRAGLVVSRRGPGGGFGLGRDQRSISLLHIFEALEGSLPLVSCLLGSPICKNAGCIFGGMLEKISLEFLRYLAETYLIDIKNVYSLEGCDEKVS